MTRKNDKSKKKLKNKKHPIRLRVTNVRDDTEKRNQLYDEAERRATLGKYQLATGTWQHPRTGLWQVWMSSYGSDVNWISVHRDETRAKQDVEEIKAAGQRGDLYDEDKVVALFERLSQAGDAEPENMSAAELAQITASIGGMVFEARQGQHPREDESENLALVLAELTPGKISVGFRLGQQDMVDLIASDLSPQEAAQLAADISQGRVDLEELSRRPMREVYFPIDQAAPETAEPTTEYKYTLPEDDQEVIVSGIAMAILDIAKQPPLQDAHAIQERALWHCEQSRKHSRIPLTNDYEGFKQLFISSYTGIYERDPRELTGAVRDIINRYSIEIALAETRNIVKGLYFPDIADLERLSMEYEQVLMTPHRSLDGYYATFTWHGAVQRTPDLATPVAALAQAQRMIDKLKTT
jgi:hypothetical protein